MNTLFEKQGGQYELQGDYRLPCVVLPQDTNEHIGVWGKQHRRYLKASHRVQYYNLLTAGKLNSYLADINQQAEKMFDELVKSLAEKENVTENLKADAPMKWVAQINNIRSRATEIVNAKVIYV